MNTTNTSSGAGVTLIQAFSVILLVGCSGQPRTDSNAALASTTRPTYSVNNPDTLPEALTLQLRNHRGYLLGRVTIDGRDAGLFMFDTGSNLNVISTGVAGRLKLPVEGSSQATGVGGLRLLTTAP